MVTATHNEELRIKLYRLVIEFYKYQMFDPGSGTLDDMINSIKNDQSNNNLTVYYNYLINEKKINKEYKIKKLKKIKDILNDNNTY